MNTKAVERNVAEAMRGVTDVEKRMHTVYALLDSVRASLEEQGRKETEQIKALQDREEHEKQTAKRMDDDMQQQIDEENKPPTDKAVASLEAQQEKPFLQEERARMED